MIQRAVTAIIGVVIGLFATFSVFEAILAGLDNFYLLTQDACNIGTESRPIRTLRMAHVDTGGNSFGVPTSFEDVDWGDLTPTDTNANPLIVIFTCLLYTSPSPRDS